MRRPAALLRVTVAFALLIATAVALVVFSFGKTGELEDDHSLHRGSVGSDPRVAFPELRYVPGQTARTWEEREYLVVFGVATVVSTGRLRRQGQRRTCWSAPGVARRANNFTGSMLMLYAIGWHPLEISTDALLAEAAEWHDMVALPLNEAQRIFYKRQFRPDSIEVLMSFKTLMWYDLALRLFPRTPYIVKADDDIFAKVPQYLADLHTLPRKQLFWGRILSGRLSPSSAEFPFVVGYCSTMSRDVAEQVVSHKPLRRLAFSHRYDDNRMDEYRSLMMHREDQMVGYALQQREYPFTLVTEKLCRVQNRGEWKNRNQNFKQTAVVVHDVKKLPHFVYLDSRISATNATPKTLRPTTRPVGFRGKDVYEFDC